MGAHVPVGRGLATGGLAYADRVGPHAVQVYVSNPRGWAPAAGSAHEAFRALFTHPAGRGVPVIVETPQESHAADIATLTALRDSTPHRTPSKET
ncbi:MAG: hypothetical protein ACR2JQ_11065 [Mycobacteriales bacterium]